MFDWDLIKRQHDVDSSTGNVVPAAGRASLEACDDVAPDANDGKTAAI